MRNILLATAALTLLPLVAMAQTVSNAGTGTSAGSASTAGAESQDVAAIDQAFNSSTPSHETINSTPALGTQIVTPTATCTIPVGVQGVGLDFGFGAGTAYTVEYCKQAEITRLTYDMGDRADAVEMLCLQQDFRKERAIVGQPCPPPFGPSGLTNAQQREVNEHFAKLEAERPRVVEVFANPMAIMRAKFCASLNPKKVEDRPYITQCLKDH
jgi:hypothetical protein